MNETLRTIAERYSCRDFDPSKPVSDEQIKAIVDAAVAAPSAKNTQPWRVIAIRNKELIADLEAEAMRVIAAMEDQTMYNMLKIRGGTVLYHAPCVIWIPIDRSLPNAPMDCGIICQNIALAATSLGLGSVICALAGNALKGGKEEEFNKRIGVPEGFESGCAVLIGHIRTPGAPHAVDTAKISYID